MIKSSYLLAGATVAWSKRLAFAGLLGFLGLLLIAAPTSASTTDCKYLYVNQIQQANLTALAVNFKNSSGPDVTSYWLRFNGWGDERRDRALSLMLTAQALGHYVDIGTTASDQCSIWSAAQDIDWVMKRQEP